MIYYTMPFDSTKNIGKYYNNFMDILPTDNDWACFADGDTLFTTYNYGTLIEKAIEENPTTSCFTCFTNRVNCPWQIAPGIDTASNDIMYHRNFGEKLKTIYGTRVLDVTNTPPQNLLSGFCFILKKSSWKTIGGFKEGMLGVDNDLHRKLQKHGLKFLLIEGLYLYHWYRNGDANEKSHLI